MNGRISDTPNLIPEVEITESVGAKYRYALVNDHALRPLRTRLSLGKYIKEVFGRRHFIYAEARNRAFQRGRDTFLGKSWIILTPLLNSALYALVFGLLLKTNRGIDNFIGFLVIGVVFYGLATSGITTGSGLIQSSKSMIQAFNFPRASVCVSHVLRDFLDGLPQVLVAVVVALLFQFDSPPNWTLLLIPVIYILLGLFTLGCCFIFARLTAFVPDLRSIVSLFVRALFFLSGVFFSVERFATQPVLREAMLLNPVYQFISAMRSVVLDGQVPSVFTFSVLLSWTAIVLIAGTIYFWAGEERYISVK